MGDMLMRLLTKVGGKLLTRIREEEASRVHMLYHAQGMYLRDQVPLKPPGRPGTSFPPPPLEDRV